MHDYNLYKLTVLQKVYVKWERKEKEIVIKILITDNQVTLLLHDRTLSRKLFNNVHVNVVSDSVHLMGFIDLTLFGQFPSKKGNCLYCIFFVIQW